MSFSGNSSGLAVLRLFRLMRIVKIVRFLPGLQRQLMVMFYSVDHVAVFFVLLAFFLFISALLGMSIFGCKFCTLFSAQPPSSMTTTSRNQANSTTMVPPKQFMNLVNKTSICQISVLALPPTGANNNEEMEFGGDFLDCPLANFDSLSQAILTVLQV